MKISVAPPFVPPRSLPGAVIAPAPAAPEPADPLAFERQIAYGENSKIDEAAVSLVDLSVIVYSPLDTIRRAFAKLDLAPAAFDASGDRAADFQWLEDRPWHAYAAKLRKGPPLPKLKRDARNRAPRVLAFRHGARAYVAFRGSKLLDWRRNFMVWPGKSLPLRHRGFEVTWMEVRAQVEGWLARATSELGTKPTVYLGGHSLGGAVATLAAVDLAAAGYPIGRVVTLGSPRVGGRMFFELYEASPAAPDATGPRCLVQVTTRFVHGTDAITVLPPWPFALHVAPPEPLRAEDRLRLDDFVGQGLFDTTALLALAGVPPPPGYTGGLVPAQPVPRLSLLRLTVTQVLAWIAMHYQGLAWLRWLPLLPPVVEQTRVSFFQHFRARYWRFLPPTILRSVFAVVVAAPQPRKPAITPPRKPG